MNSIHEDRLKKRSAEINKERLMAAITNYCHETKGIFPKNTDAVWFTDLGANVPIEIIQMHAKELGYINGYRWGVEYNLSPSAISDLGDIRITLLDLKADAEDIMQDGKFSRVDLYNKFKITDQRYKPADTSYLSVSEIPESKSSAENANDWWDYEADKMIHYPPAGVECEVYNREFGMNAGWEKCKILFMGKFKCVYSSESCHERVGNIDITGAIGLRPLGYNRKAEAEKKRVVDAVQQLIHEFDHCAYVSDDLLEFLHDKDCLRTPAN